jgi:hypothetical protein
MRELTIGEFARMGGLACQAKRTPEERSAAARKAINARWKKVRAAKRQEALTRKTRARA